MATINLGRVGFVNKGAYSSSTTYKINDVVTYNNGTYACIQASTGQVPTNTTYWQNWVSNAVVHNTGDETVDGIKTFVKSPIVPTPTAGTQAVNKYYVDSKVGTGVYEHSKSLATNGYMRFTNGLIIQWGTYSGVLAHTSTYTATFPITFPNACIQVNCQYGNTPIPTSSGVGFTKIDQKLKNSFTFQWGWQLGGSAQADVDYVAIGY